MPKIDAATVAEHRLQVQGRLVDAAETLLRADPTAALTAGAVSSADTAPGSAPTRMPSA